MGDGQDHDHYVEQLREVFNSFDSSGAGTLSAGELSHLCQSLHLDEATPTLLQTLLQNQHTVDVGVDFEQFKNALILVLSSTIEQTQVEPEPLPEPASPEIRPKFVKGSKRYGRRSTPEFIESGSDLSEVPAPVIDLEDNYESAIPAKRERWIAHETSTEYEAEGQMHLWNPDEPLTPRGSVVSLSGRLEERLHDACDNLALSWDGLASHSELLSLCEHQGIELTGDVLQTLNSDGVMSVQEFVSRVTNHNKPPTPSASTPYRQLKRMHSTQPFDEVGRRIATPSALTSTIGLRLFSTLDDGTGFTPVEHILDSWLEEGIENSTEILQALNFDLDGKLSLSDLTLALENELLVTKNGIHQAALASFKAEIRHLKECVDREIREKEKIQSDLEKAERLKTQLATEVDEHHSAIEQMNKLNLRKLEQDHKDKLSSVRSELMKEMEQMQQQSSVQREELEAEIHKIREDETFLRDHLSISVKENRRLEMELLDTAEKLVESQNQITKLQTNLNNIMKEKFGDLDPGSAELFIQEERIKQLHNSYDAQCRELQDRIDELQSELQEFHSIGRVLQPGPKPLSEELESKSPGMESDPGLGSEEVQPFSMSLEAEMMLEQLKDRHLQEMDELRSELESKIHECEELVEKQRASQEDQKAALVQQHQQELQSLKEAISSIQSHAEELQRQLDQTRQERPSLEQKQAEEMETLQEEEVQTVRQQLLEAHIKNTDLEDQLRSLEEQQTEMNENLNYEMDELKTKHTDEIAKLEQTQAEVLEGKIQDEKSRLLSEFEREREGLKQNYENELLAKLELKFEKEQNELVQKLTEQWQKERLHLDEQNTENLQVLLEDEMLKLVKEHEEKENKLQEQWESEKLQIKQQHEEDLLHRLHLQTVEFEFREKKLKDDLQREKMQLEEDYEGMVQERVMEEKDKMEAEKEEEEKRFERLMEKERDRLQEKQQEKVKELTDKHRQEREELSSNLEKLREEIVQERSEASRLCEENLILKQKIDALKEEDLKQLIQTMENLKKEKTASRKAADDFKKQISELQSQSQRLEDKNGLLSEKNTQHISDMESLRQQLASLVEESESKEHIPTDDKTQLSACVSALEAELNKALDDTEMLKQRNSQLSEQVCALRDKAEKMDLLKRDLSALTEEKRTLVKETQVLCNELSKAQEKVKAADENVQIVTLQSSRLKADVRVLQQQKDSLQHDMALLHKKLQNANDKNKVLEMALHSPGLQSQSKSKKVLREELARLLEQDQKIAKQENDRLQAEVLNVKGDLRQAREKVRQLDSTVVLLKQQKQAQSSQLLNMEKENMVLKQELEAQKEKTKGREAGGGLPDIERVLQENESLKSQMCQLSTQLIETFQAQLVGLLPPSPIRTPRRQHRGEEAENMQDERERKMKNMEERMREIELSLHNVKLLLKEKVAQLKDQLHKNGKADVLIKDLYVENDQLLKALEITEQRHRIAEKKNYLLEEKISSLTKILRDLNPSTLPTLQYHFTSS